jgi:hypothetical protein
MEVLDTKLVSGTSMITHSSDCPAGHWLRHYEENKFCERGGIQAIDMEMFPLE